MKRLYILIYNPDNLNSILGVYTSGKKLATAAAELTSDLESDCMVKTVEVNCLRNNEAGHDYQGTILSEFLTSAIARTDE